MAVLNSAAADFVNFESPQVHPLDLSPGQSKLAVCNTADDRVEIFNILADGSLEHRSSIFAGLDPVSARFRNEDELWVVNLVSDSVSVIDLTQDTVIQTLQTLDEPCDVVFAGAPQKAYVSCSAVNTIQVFQTANLSAAPSSVMIEGEDPRALAVSPDGSRVYAAVFESGNGTTILMGGFEGPTKGSAENGGAAQFMPNVVGLTIANYWQGPYGGQNPPPNAGGGFNPPLNPANPPAPAVGHIVKYNAAQDKWLDDNNGDWTRLVAGDVSQYVGRRADWELVDNDVAIINTANHSVSYVERMMHLCMAIGVNPATGRVAVVGTDATNVTRFEPNLQGRFIRVNTGIFDPNNPATPSVVDLNPHLNYSTATVPQQQRDLSIGDPRGIAWKADGTRAYVVGRGSNNVITMNANGVRISNFEVGEGPTGVAVNDAANRLYVLNQFDASVSVVDLTNETEVERAPFFDPTPSAIKEGRKFLFDTHRTSGLGQISCASCHVDTRMDRLAWDLGDPSGSMTSLNPSTMNLGGNVDGPPTDFTDFHPMKGPMKTQTLQDIIGKEPLHWRGDRAGIEHFNGAFQSLQGDDTSLTKAEMQQLKNYLATIHFPPNPFRNLDNSLPKNVPLTGFFGGGKFDDKGLQLPNGNAQRGLNELYRPFARGIDQGTVSCVTCHSLPSGVGMNAVYNSNNNTYSPLPLLPDGNARHLLIQTDGSVQKTFKSSQLRNLYDQTGLELTQQRSLSGFGIQHDGSIPNLAVYFESLAFTTNNTQEVADLVALMLAFSGGDFGPPVDNNEPPPTPSKDAHAAVGKQVTLTNNAPNATLQQLLSLATSNEIDVVAKAGSRSWLFNGTAFQAAQSGLTENLTAVLDHLPVSFMAVPEGTGIRAGFDRDRDGLLDFDEVRDLSPVAGLQNPFAPDSADSTGDNGSVNPDGVPDAQNDFDGDGVSNAAELLAGTNPVENITPELPLEPVITFTVDNRAQVRWEGSPLAIYQLRQSSNLVDWTDAPGGRFEIGAAAESLTWTSPESAPRSFFEVIRIR
ncbi:MAG: beta-propeller fold lactonase family protein [Verrucomicrobiota bacterium]